MDTSQAESWLFDKSDDVFAILEKNGFTGLDAKEKVFHLVWSLEAEVNNGGFHQFFINSAGDLAQETPDALVKIGAGKTATIVTRAMELFGAPPSADHAQRNEQLETLENQTDGEIVDWFSELDDQFYKYEDDLSALLYTFMQKP